LGGELETLTVIPDVVPAGVLGVTIEFVIVSVTVIFVVLPEGSETLAPGVKTAEAPVGSAVPVSERVTFPLPFCPVGVIVIKYVTEEEEP